MKRWLLATVLLVGCGQSVTDYFPLKVGTKWTYEVTIDNVVEVIDITVAERAPVGEYDGFLLTSAMGDSRLAWNGDVLLAAELAGTRYSPPIPIFAEANTGWSGVVQTEGVQVAGTATLSVESDTIENAGRDFETVVCVLNLESGDEALQLRTWYYPGLGILRQEQRSGRTLERDRKIDFVSGPD